MKSVSQSLHRFNHSHDGYGLGFRRTRKKNIAKEWVGPSKTTSGVMNTYSLDIESMISLPPTNQ